MITIANILNAVIIAYASFLMYIGQIGFALYFIFLVTACNLGGLVVNKLLK